MWEVYSVGAFIGIKSKGQDGIIILIRGSEEMLPLFSASIDKVRSVSKEQVVAKGLKRV